MTTLSYPYWILLLAIVLFVLEVFIPSGGILGGLSALAFLAAIGSAFAEGGLTMGTTFMAVTAVLIPMLLFALIKIWPRTYFGKQILIDLPSSEEVLPERQRKRQQLIGRQGVAVTSLLPSGAIKIEGKTYDAISDGMTIDKGMIVEVTAVRNNAIVVRPAAEIRPQEPSSAESARSLDTVIPDPFEDSI